MALNLEKAGGTKMTGGLEKNYNFIFIDFGSVKVYGISHLLTEQREKGILERNQSGPSLSKMQ